MPANAIARRVARKELALFFSSPVAWLFLAGFAATTLFVFFWAESFFARNIADVRPLFQWMPLLLIFLSAALTMRMWSEERRAGTLEHVLTQPAGLWRFVLGKFLACLALLLLALVATVPLPVTVALIADLDAGPVVAGYLATILLGSSYISIGLYVSSRTDNPIVSLIGTVALCGLLYLAGSDILTGFFDNRAGSILRQLGSGARFNSVARGVLDLRDLIYYLSITTAFLSLNVYSLEKERWSSHARSRRHRQWRTAIVLVLLNLLLANAITARLELPRVDMTEGRMHSLSTASRDLLAQLREPLLLRAYFSARTHPALAPLEPRLRDLMREFELGGNGRVRVEFIDPSTHPELEQEANERYGINATPFQVADRYQAALVNAYFDVLVQYGSQHQTLGFSDLIEVRTAPNSQPEVLLRNPEFDISRAIKEVLYNYRSGGDLFQAIDEPVEFIAYISADELLPQLLLAYKDSIRAQLEQITPRSAGKLSVRFIEPEAAGGGVARQIADEWGFKPMVAALGDEQEFFFYLTLADKRQVVQLPTDNFDPTDFRRVLDSGLKRFASGFSRTVALALPPATATITGAPPQGPAFANLEREVARDHGILMEDLEDGAVDPEADILAVLAPKELSPRALLAVDQFLMRGGSVVLSSSPFSAGIENGKLRLRRWHSGLDQWLAHLGIRIDESLVLDRQNAAFPSPTTRQAGGYEFRDLQMIDYPYFLDLRDGGMAREHPITASLPHLTMAWASPLEVERNEQRRVARLLWSSPNSWRSGDLDIMPTVSRDGLSIFQPQAGAELQPEEVGVVLQGRFDSWFAADAGGAQKLQAALPEGEAAASLVTRSPESARLVLYSSNDFLSDRVLNALVTASGTQYLGPLELFGNTLDWALQEDQLLGIRSRGHFNRTLPPMERRAQILIEYFNYGLAACWLLLLAALHWLLKILRRRRYRRGLQL